MAWTDPRTWQAGDLFDVDYANNQVLDNLEWLYNPPIATVTVSGTPTTTSAGFVGMTGGSVSLTTTGGNVTMLFTGRGYNSNSGVSNIYTLAIDGANQGDSVWGLTAQTTEAANHVLNARMRYMTDTPPDPGEHVFAVQWRVTANTGSLQWGKLWAWESH